MTGTFRWQHRTTEFVNRLQAILENPRFERFIIGAIVINGITLGLETSSTVMARAGAALACARPPTARDFRNRDCV